MGAFKQQQCNLMHKQDDVVSYFKEVQRVSNIQYAKYKHNLFYISKLPLAASSD